MTSRERLLTILRGDLPDCVPCCPDISNMIPCRLTGKPFWDIYAFKDPPLWKANIDALKFFDLDGGFCLSIDVFGDGDNPDLEERIVHRHADGAFSTRHFCRSTGEWSKHLYYYTADQPRAYNILPEKLGLPAVPTEWEPLTGVKPWPKGMELFQLVRREMGEQGIVGVGSGATTCVLNSPEDIYSYYDNPVPWRERVHCRLAEIERKMKIVAAMKPRPDILFCGGSGSLIWQTPEIFRELALPLLKRATELACDLNIPTHVHSCGPEKALVAMAAEETRLTVVDPLEIPPMGDCSLVELKKRYGDKIILKGNLHTTDVMLRGSVDMVKAASRQAIDDAGRGGRFILSTGDQCGRDTPFDNLRAMLETARTYGRY